MFALLKKVDKFNPSTSVEGPPPWGLGPPSAWSGALLRKLLVAVPIPERIGGKRLDDEPAPPAKPCNHQRRQVYE